MSELADALPANIELEPSLAGLVPIDVRERFLDYCKRERIEQRTALREMLRQFMGDA